MCQNVTQNTSYPFFCSQSRTQNRIVAVLGIGRLHWQEKCLQVPSPQRAVETASGTSGGSFYGGNVTASF